MREHERPHLDEQRETISRLMRPQPTVIGIEGGPCSGKTTLVERLKRKSGERQVVCLPEAATEIISRLAAQGVSVAELEYGDRPGWLAFEAELLATIISNIDEAVEAYAGTDTIIVADRADIGAYVTECEYAGLLAELGETMPPMLSRVDALYYLPSLARLDPPRYEELMAGNAARYESSAGRAQEVCVANLAAVGRHPELHVIWGGDFDRTLDGLVRTILSPETELEAKLRPRADDSLVRQFYKRSELLGSAEIEQRYFELDGTVFRLRRTVTGHGETLHTFTVKTGEGVKRHETQRRINHDTYETLSRCEPVGAPLLKRRDSLLVEHGGVCKLWSVDEYHDCRLPRWNLETDVEDEAEAVMWQRLEGFEAASLSAEKLARSLGVQALAG